MILINNITNESKFQFLCFSIDDVFKEKNSARTKLPRVMVFL